VACGAKTGSKGAHRTFKRDVVFGACEFFDYRFVVEAERFADSENGTGRTREAIRDLSTAFALLTSFKMTKEGCMIQKIHKLSRGTLGRQLKQQRPAAIA